MGEKRRVFLFFGLTNKLVSSHIESHSFIHFFLLLINYESLGEKALLLSGSEDCEIKVWKGRKFRLYVRTVYVAIQWIEATTFSFDLKRWLHAKVILQVSNVWPRRTICGGGSTATAPHTFSFLAEDEIHSRRRLFPPMVTTMMTSKVFLVTKLQA